MVAKQQPEEINFGLFAIFLWASIGTCKFIKHPQILLTKTNQHIQETNTQLYITTNHFGHMVFVANQKQKKTFNFREISSRPDKSDFIMAMLKEERYMHPGTIGH